ncbi:hypothetical protein H257_13408 [Aphanomyces astaci]|uniref:Uncharacterized protein n=1 Tax=Aphanomyces astaci TaxID=112090 RepID=W4FUU0_APHAT|nr:hypothetical protein H257_13408 [Aphanomyces astaci]ETV71270.1 hypothetical protein H257_13408 [Aphanomyces astaci]|eukprot:XP_009839210.1 hypothetical protein H257_13408 [Aphanomyces astaci]
MEYVPNLSSFFRLSTPLYIGTACETPTPSQSHLSTLNYKGINSAYLSYNVQCVIRKWSRQAASLGRRSATTTQCVWRQEGTKVADVSVGLLALLEETNPNPWTPSAVPTRAAAEVPLPDASSAGASAPGDVDMGDDEPVKVLNAPALPLPPSFKGSTKAERRAFMR